jgi:uncharacterized membrane protein YhaH (DUF805 family)/Tfp pilus assembly protein PilE
MSEAETPTQPIGLLSAAGRIGRLRYIARGVGLWFFGLAVIGVLAAVLLPSLGTAGGIVVLLAFTGLLVLAFILTVQRCHDFNASGWLSLLLLVPLANFAFWFIPGSPGENRFGAPPPPNGAAVIVGIIALPVVVIFMAGVLAAVAIPAYQDMTHRQQVADAIFHGATWRAAVNEHYAAAKALPSSAADLRQGAAPAAAGATASAALAANGVILLTMAPHLKAISGKTIELRPVVAGDGLKWDCFGGTLERKLRPAPCRAP